MSSRLKKRSSGAVLVGELEKAAETVSKRIACLERASSRLTVSARDLKLVQMGAQRSQSVEFDLHAIRKSVLR